MVYLPLHVRHTCIYQPSVGKYAIHGYCGVVIDETSKTFIYLTYLYNYISLGIQSPSENGNGT